jgi:hypothetical protein
MAAQVPVHSNAPRADADLRPASSIPKAADIVLLFSTRRKTQQGRREIAGG